MKKLFTLVLALMGMTTVANAATVDEIVETKHSYVMVFDSYTGNGTQARVKGSLFGAKHFLDVTGGSISTGKGKVNLSDASTLVPFNCTQEEVDALVAKYGAKYNADQFNSLRLKNNQDVIAVKLTAGSVVWVIGQGNNKSGKDARVPKFATDAALNNALNPAPTADDGSTPSGYVYKWTVPDDGLYYVGSYNSDAFFSYFIVEANEAPGTPVVEVGEQTYADGRWFVDITADAVNAGELGETCITYTTDGSDPLTSDTKKAYTGPVRCYQNATVKFQAWSKTLVDMLGYEAGCECPGADNEGSAEFHFNAPAISADGGNVTITTEYEHAQNYVSLNGEEATATSSVNLTQSATVVAYTVIDNQEGITFQTLSSSKDVYVLNAIKEKKTIAVTGGDVVVDDEATANSTTGTVYKVENGAISADVKDFFVKNLEFAVVKDAAYQIDGKEAYIKMNNTNITFLVAAGDEVKVKVITTKNSCKTLNAENDENVTTDRKNYVNVSGTTYGNEDVTAENGNIIEFTLKGGKTTMKDVLDADGNKVTGEDGKTLQEEVFTAGDTYYTFQKYSGTGNIMISSIEIEPVAAAAVEETVLWEGTALVNGWGDQPYLLSDGGKELTENNAAVGDVLRFYCTAPDDSWQMELTGGHWDGMYFRYAPKDQGPEADGSPRAYEIVDISKGYFDFVITEEFLTKATTAGGWGGVFVLNGDGNLTITKVTLVKGGATGIQNVKTVKVQNSAIYNLAGQRVDANYKGVVIMNGKKMILK